MREEQLGLAAGAELGAIDLRHARLAQLAPRLRPEVHLVATGAYAGADGRGAGAHRGGAAQDDLLLEAAAAAVQDRRAAGAGQRDRQAVGPEDEPDGPRLPEDVPVGLGCGPLARVDDEIGAMHLPGADHPRRVDPDRAQRLEALASGAEGPGGEGGHGARQTGLEPAGAFRFAPLHQASLAASSAVASSSSRPAISPSSLRRSASRSPWPSAGP